MPRYGNPLPDFVRLVSGYAYHTYSPGIPNLPPKKHGRKVHNVTAYNCVVVLKCFFFYFLCGCVATDLSHDTEEVPQAWWCMFTLALKTLAPLFFSSRQEICFALSCRLSEYRSCLHVDFQACVVLFVVLFVICSIVYRAG